MDNRNNIKEFLIVLDNFSGHKLNNIKDLEVLLNTAEKTNDKKIISEISFYSKFVWKVYNLLIKNPSEGSDKLQTELQINLEIVLKLLEEIVSMMDKEETKNFQKYHKQNQEGFQNLLNFISDLSWIKNYQIEHNE